MKSGRFKYGVAAFVAACFFAVACSTGASDMGNTLKKTCSMCHSTKRICLNLGVKDAAAWKSNVKRMVEKGAPLEPGKIDAAAAYLAGLAPGTGPVCR